MKKVLFATTALVATASVAAAEVTFGGYGRFGIQYDDPVAGASTTNVTSRFRLQIDATAESDAGVTFGARARIQQNNTDENGPGAGPDGILGNADDVADGGPSGTGINGVRFFAKSGNVEVGVGNIFGALEFMPGMYPIDLGLTGLGYDYTAYAFGADAYSSGGNGAAGSNGVELLYSMGDFSFHISASNSDLDGDGLDDDPIAAHIAYTWNGWTFALGAQSADDVAQTSTEFAASVGGTVGIADVTLAFADNGLAGDHWVLAAGFDVGAATNVEVFVADSDAFAETAYGIDFNHDLGGGTSIRGGIANRGSGATRADLGVRFNF
ncbi:MAG: porin [Sulfitobacter sp.]